MSDEIRVFDLSQEYDRQMVVDERVVFEADYLALKEELDSLRTFPSPNGWQASLQKLREENAKLSAALAAKDAEIERLNNRDGNSSIEIIHPVPDDPNPFHRIDLKKVDFGVADNCYVVECPEIEDELAALRAERDGLRKALGALGIAADKVHHELAIIQPFLDVFKKHGEIITECMKSALEATHEPT